MRNTGKISTLEAKFPLLAVENGCLVSKDADLTIAFKLELPELFTVTESEYEAMHSAWHKAIKVLPNYSIVHKQDWFVQENYAPELNEGELSFLARASERHFNERPYLHHAVYPLLTRQPCSTAKRGNLASSVLILLVLRICSCFCLRLRGMFAECGNS